MQWVFWLSERLNGLVEGSLFVFGFSMAIITGVQVFCRYVLNHSLFWSEEVGRMLLVWITFLGATAAYKRKAHVGIDLVVRRLPPPAEKAAELVVLALSLIFFFVLVFYGIQFMGFIAGQKTAALGIPMGLAYAVIPLSGLIFSVHALSQLLQAVRK
ncbi:TRAP-type C4-dicarboxylate transport system, small permease component [Desulfacinum hydrothermale DSM 13146]|uniref:TRAP-type C4-dicarboxylate transport system, small permease component n=1 Tax=Desulfacinum hydrothermale DSM 13146 TaxID=1121390 RepID=A0A1W1X5V2_9BACT|nr:TRAP transporter small permease [Desulfacinum hydrothermale]SMC18841.1 TRAP-type C4-dicarboxylate transport system, small permease component [Desulfacinum hydrothermale DSM 13146]